VDGGDVEAAAARDGDGGAAVLAWVRAADPGPLVQRLPDHRAGRQVEIRNTDHGPTPSPTRGADIQQF
jgi:hypothetical protein